MTHNPIILKLLTSEQGCRIGKICSVVLSVLILLTFTNTLTTWWSDARLSTVSKTATSFSQSFTESESELFHTIPEAHLFGYNPAASIGGVVITASQLRLTGIIQAGSPTGTNKVIIASEGGIGQIYQVGDVLPNGIKITAILFDGVILSNGGHTERLPLLRPTLERSA